LKEVIKRLEREGKAAKRSEARAYSQNFFKLKLGISVCEKGVKRSIKSEGTFQGFEHCTHL